MTTTDWNKLTNAPKADKFQAIVHASLNSTKEKMIAICGIDWVLAAYSWYISQNITFYQIYKPI